MTSTRGSLSASWADGLVLTPHGEEMVQIFRESVADLGENLREELTTALDDYIVEEIESEIADLKHCLLVALTGSPEERATS